MPTIVPALLESDFNTFKSRAIEAFQIPELKRLQIDVLNDTLTPGRTLSLAELPELSTLGHDDRCIVEVHMMVSNPGDYFDDAKRIGCSVVIVQFEAVEPKILSNLAADIRSMGMIPALGIYPQTTIATLREHVQILRHFAQFTLLSVEPGAQGQNMLETAPARIAGLKEMVLRDMKSIPDAQDPVSGDMTQIERPIEVDGGIRESNIAQVAAVGADLIVVGSAIFKSGDRGALHNFLMLEEALS